MKRESHIILILGLCTVSFGLAMAWRNVANPWLTNFSVATMAVGCSLFVLGERRKQLFHATARQLAGATIAGLVLVAATHTLYAVGTSVTPALSVSVAQLYEGVHNRMPNIVLTIPLVVAVVLAEEMVWRGLAFDLMQRRLSPRSAVLAATIFYALPQVIGGTWLLVLAALLLGLFLTIQRLVTKNLLAPVVTHAIWSISVFVIVPLG